MVCRNRTNEISMPLRTKFHILQLATKRKQKLNGNSTWRGRKKEKKIQQPRMKKELHSKFLFAHKYLKRLCLQSLVWFSSSLLAPCRFLFWICTVFSPRSPIRTSQGKTAKNKVLVRNKSLLTLRLFTVLSSNWPFEMCIVLLLFILFSFLSQPEQQQKNDTQVSVNKTITMRKVSDVFFAV